MVCMQTSYIYLCIRTEHPNSNYRIKCKRYGYGTWSHFPAPTWWLTPSASPVLGIQCFLRPSRTPGKYRIHIHICRQTLINRTFKMHMYVFYEKKKKKAQTEDYSSRQTCRQEDDRAKGMGLVLSPLPSTGAARACNRKTGS